MFVTFYSYVPLKETDARLDISVAWRLARLSRPSEMQRMVMFTLLMLIPLELRYSKRACMKTHKGVYTGLKSLVLSLYACPKGMKTTTTTETSCKY
jgi:hypothetical protein